MLIPILLFIFNCSFELFVIRECPEKSRQSCDTQFKKVTKYCHLIQYFQYEVNVIFNISFYFVPQQAQKPVKESFEDTEKPSKMSTAVQRKIHIENTSDEDEIDYDPEYGTVKDKFWKDLELGRHQNHAQLFSGDMYSKVKGCRRAAHAEAVANIQKQQQPNKPETTSSSIKALSQAQKSSVKLKLQRMSGKKNQFKASPSVSNFLGPNKKALPQRNLTSVGSRARKRSTDPFSASGYTSAKRSRRSKEVKATKRSSSCSVTSETLGIVTTTGLMSPTRPATLTNSTSASSLISTSSASEAPSKSVSSLDTSAAHAPGINVIPVETFIIVKIKNLGKVYCFLFFLFFFLF